MEVITTVSGKGGTGKTTISVAIAKALGEKYKVGLFDVDVSGANAHRLVKIVEGYDVLDGPRIKPAVAEIDGVKIQFLSIALVSESYVGWRPGEHGEFVSQLFKMTDWDVDYLIMDAPPGAHDDVIEALKNTDVAVLVTIPSELSELDARRTLELLSDMEIPVAGQYLNFSYAICPYCKRIIKLFQGNPLPEVPIIERIPFVEGIPEINASKLIRAIKHAKIYKLKKRSKIKRTLLEAFLRRVGR